MAMAAGGGVPVPKPGHDEGTVEGKAAVSKRDARRDGGADGSGQGPACLTRTASLPMASLPMASLPMYVFPALAAAHQALWDRLRAGLADAPERLDLTRPPVPDGIGPEVLFTQVCGYPLFQCCRGQAAILGTPHYGLEGCDGPMHRAAFIVRAANPADSLRDAGGHPAPH